MTKKASEDDDDEVLGEAEPLPSTIPDGEYLGALKCIEQGVFEGRKRYFLWFYIVDGPYLDTELYLACPWPKVGRTFHPSSKLWQAHVVACGQAPKKKDGITKKAFKFKIFKFATRTVTKNRDGSPKKVEDQYSVIDRLICCETSN